MRTQLIVFVLPFLAACAGTSSTTSDMLPHPDWTGPAVHARHVGNRDLEIELIAPTAGHAFTVADVVITPHHVDVRCVHRLPTADFVAQVVTPLRVAVPAERLGQARVVCVYVATGDGPSRLAIATARP